MMNVFKLKPPVYIVYAYLIQSFTSIARPYSSLKSVYCLLRFHIGRR